MPTRNQLGLPLTAMLIAGIAVSCENRPPTTDGVAGGPATEEVGSTADSSMPAVAGATLTTEVADGVMARSTVLDSGDIEVELHESRSGKLVAKGWLSVADRVFTYTFVDQVADGSSRGEVSTSQFTSDITLENVNLEIGELWSLRNSSQDTGPLAYNPYAPGCHFLTNPVGVPNDARNACIQDCCGIFQQWDYLYLCDFIPDPTMSDDVRSLLEALRKVSHVPLLPTKLPMFWCPIGQDLFAACVAKCALFPVPEEYWYCVPGEHRCFDSRCGGWPAGTLYCAENCYSDESPCDTMPTGATEFCNVEDGSRHACPDGDLRQGYWAADCDTTVRSCDCRDQGKWRCVDDRCPAGRNGYCANTVGEYALIAALADDQHCDPTDTTNPCCGAKDQPCCDTDPPTAGVSGVCEGTLDCVSSKCIVCGGLNEKPCATSNGLRCDDDLDYRGTGNCVECGYDNHLCCSNSIQYRTAGNDVCPDSTPYYRPNVPNYTQCVNDLCVQCGWGGVPCCPEGIGWGDTTYSGIRCFDNATCSNGICPDCGNVGQKCCPGGPPFMSTNYCKGSMVSCMSGTCKAMTPPPAPRPAAWTLDSSSVVCGGVLGGILRFVNVGGSTADLYVTENLWNCYGSSETTMLAMCPAVAPGGLCEAFINGWDYGHTVFVNGTAIETSTCGCVH